MGGFPVAHGLAIHPDTTKDTTMSFTFTRKAALKAATVQAARADAAEARALELEATLQELTRAVGTCKQHVYLTDGMLNRLFNADHPNIRAPHDQDPRVQSALTEARRVLGGPF